MATYLIALLVHIISVFSGTLLSWRIASINTETPIRAYRIALFLSLATLFGTGLFLYTSNPDALNHSPLFLTKVVLSIALFASIAINDRAVKNIFLWFLIMLVSVGERAPILIAPMVFASLLAYKIQTRLSPASE